MSRKSRDGGAGAPVWRRRELAAKMILRCFAPEGGDAFPLGRGEACACRGALCGLGRYPRRQPRPAHLLVGSRKRLWLSGGKEPPVLPPGAQGAGSLRPLAGATGLSRLDRVVNGVDNGGNPTRRANMSGSACLRCSVRQLYSRPPLRRRRQPAQRRWRPRRRQYPPLPPCQHWRQAAQRRAMRWPLQLSKRCAWRALCV
jgi:hypothetical protein